MTVKKLTNRLKNVALGALCLSCAGLAALPAAADTAGQFQDIDLIRQAAEDFALDRLDVDMAHVSNVSAEAGNLDARLHLAACDLPLESFSMSASTSPGRTTVGVRCTGSSPWTLYVPVRVDASVEVLAAARALSRGEAAGPALVEYREVSMARLPAGYLTDPGQLENMELARNLQPGDILTNRMFRARELIKRGQGVLIYARTPGIEVKMAGVAMESGVSGQLIRVQNSNSGRTVQAVVQDDGTVVAGL